VEFFDTIIGVQSTLYFYGAAGSVTGSHFLLDIGTAKVLVDCGLRQGLGEERNWDDFPYNPADVSYLFVTHAHLDHIGRIPFLVKKGFKGQIISTTATRALVEPMLYDAMEILVHTAVRLDKPELYNKGDIEAALKLWRGVGYHEKVTAGDVEAQLYDAGHILGSAMVRFERGGRAVAFTGDLGGGNSPLLPPTEDLPHVDYLVMEGTYGDRTRPEDEARKEKLEDAIEDAAARGGTLVIPAFSTERTQDLLFDIRKLYIEKRVPPLPVYLDSPLAEKVTEAYVKCPEYFAPDIRARVEGGENIFAFPQLRFVATPEESRRLDALPEQKVILAGSGMSSGGRVFGHEKKYLPDPKSTILIVGYQAVGTVGRQLIEGTTSITVHKTGEKIPVKARIETLYGYSAHRDAEGLLEFANKASSNGTKEIFVVHGEPAATMFLAQRVRDYLGVKATAPEAGDKAMLDL
jgi:metallo-beta-lactamase family protein